MNHELAKTLTTALVQFIDRERPERSMCCSNTECVRIEKAFEGGTYDVVEKLIKRKLSGLTEFENAFVRLLSMSQGEPPKGIEDFAKEHSKELLALAKKELLGKWNEDMKDEYARGKKDGFTIGYNKAMKEYNESVAYHFPIMPTPPSGWGCDGTHCTNPHGDCINCPRRFSSGGTITTPNTASGTSTAKAEG